MGKHIIIKVIVMGCNERNSESHLFHFLFPFLQVIVKYNTSE